MAWCRVERRRLPEALDAHAFFQLYVADGRLSPQLYQRSADIWAISPSALRPTRCSPTCSPSEAGLEVGDFIWTGRRLPRYSNHTEQVTDGDREPTRSPRLELTEAPSMFSTPSMTFR